MEIKTFVIKYKEENIYHEVIWHAENEDLAFESFRNSYSEKDFGKVLWVKIYSLFDIADIFWTSSIEK